MLYEIDLVAWLLAAVTAFIVGAVWFGPKTFFPVWWRAMGRSADEPPTGNMAQIFGGTILGALVQTFVLGSALAGLGVSGVLSGAVTAFVLAVGLAAFTSLSHRLFSGQGAVVWALEVGDGVLALTLAGAVFGYFLS